MEDDVVIRHKDDEYIRIVGGYPTSFLKVTAGINLLYVVYFLITTLFVLLDSSEQFIRRVIISSLLSILAGVYTWMAMHLLRFNITARALTVFSFPVTLLLLYPFSLILLPIQLYSLIIHAPTRKQFAKNEKDEETS